MTLASAFLVLITTGRVAPAQVLGRPAEEVAGEAARLMDAYAQGWNFQGVVLVADGDTILYEGAYGLANADDDIPLTSDSSFRIASLSKQFTATALLRLRDEGRVDFDAPLSTYLVRLKPEIANNVTLASAFGHTAGLARAPRSMARDRREQDHFELRELIDLINQTELESPGEFRYSNAGYVLAAAVLERVTGKPYDHAVQELVFAPHGLDRTEHATRHNVVPGRAQGYCLIDGTTCRAKEIDAASVIGAGSIRSSARDLWRWAVAIQNSDAHSERTREEFLARPASRDDRYRYGWNRTIYTTIPTGERSLWLEHGGDQAGFESRMAMSYEQGPIVIVLSNRTVGFTGYMSRTLTRMVLGEETATPQRLAWWDVERTLFAEGLDEANTMRDRLREESAYGLPGPGDLLRHVDNCFSTDRHEDALLGARYYQASFPDDTWSDAFVGLALARCGMTSKARRVLRGVIEEHPELAEPKAWLERLED